MRIIKVWPVWLALAAAAGACTTIVGDFDQAQPIVFEFKQVGTQCEVKRGQESYGKMSASNSTLRVQKNYLPLDLDCSGRGKTRLQAQVKPGDYFKYPDTIIVDMAAKKVLFSDIASARQQSETAAAAPAPAPIH